MLPEVAAYVDELSDLHRQAQEILRQMDARALDYAPRAGFNSACAVVTHMAGSQKWWIGQVLGGREMHRDREIEFRAAGVDAVTLAQRLDESLALVKDVLETVTPETLDQTRQARDRTVAVRYVLTHVLAHTAVHLGHLELTRQLWESNQK